MIIVQAALVGLSVALFAPVLVLAVQTLAASMARGHADSPYPRDGLPSTCVLVPAHDEALGIREALESIRSMLPPGFQILVVADNCTDATADIARDAGAEVVGRVDPDRRGKGYALEHGIRHLRREPPEVVIVVDADCRPEEGLFERLSALAASSGRPVQALYVMTAPSGAGSRAKIAEFAWAVKNQVRPLGARRLGWPCQLMGTGMALPWRVVDRASFSGSSLVEDLQYGIELARNGTPPLFCPEAVVTSCFPLSSKGTKEQRARWERGHLSMIVHQGAGLISEGTATRNAALLALALDLCVPPVALLSMLVALSTAVAAVYFLASSELTPLLLALGVAALLTATMLLAWAHFGRNIVSLRELAAAPLYALGKVPMYLRFLRRRETAWVRTERDRGEP